MTEKINRTKLQKSRRIKRQSSVSTDWRIADLWEFGLIGKIVEKLKDKENERLSDESNG